MGSKLEHNISRDSEHKSIITGQKWIIQMLKNVLFIMPRAVDAFLAASTHCSSQTMVSFRGFHYYEGHLESS